MPFTQSIWINEADKVEVIDQRQLPFVQTTKILETVEQTCFAIKEMVVRGAPLIGVTAAFGMYLAAKNGDDLELAYQQLHATRPTAINLKWALDKQIALANSTTEENLVATLKANAIAIMEEDIQLCERIGAHGLDLIQSIYERKQSAVNILTHCNAGWLATVQWGTATAPMYKGHHAGIPIHVWVDETRPRNQGARLTAWELQQANIPHHVIVDNAGGHLMQHQQVDLVLVGSDRTAANGDVCNKIGTYLKALAAHDNNIPFYAALPYSTIDWTIKNGVQEIPIEERGGNEVIQMNTFSNNEVQPKNIMAVNTAVANFAFDVTPAKYITGIITERGICEASAEGLQQLYQSE